MIEELEELLVQLSPRVIDTDFSARGTKPLKLTTQDLAAVVAMTGDKAGGMLVALRIADFTPWAPEVFGLLLPDVTGKFLENRWYKDGAVYQIAADMLTLALHEHVTPNRCPDCRGRGWRFPPGAAPAPCARCDQLGIVDRSEMWRARQLKIDKRNWQRRWRERYGWVRATLAARDAAACDDIRAALGANTPKTVKK